MTRGTDRGLDLPVRADRRGALRVAAALAGQVTAPALWAAAPGTDVEFAVAEVNVVESRPGHRIAPALFGSNLQWEHGGDGALVDGHLAPELLRQLGAAHLSTLRFPGGDLANRYRWKTAVGPRERRQAGLNYAGHLEASDFGTDEFITLCAAARLAPVITVNPNAGADEAADWVEYFNSPATSAWGSRRAANGHAAPLRALWWEVGNESFTPSQPGFAGAQDYARRYLAFRTAMKARDPAVQVGLVLEASFLQAAWMAGIHPHLARWNDDVLRVAAAQADFGVVHFYSPQDKRPRDDELHRAALSGSDVFGANLALVREALRRHGRPGLPLLVSEYGLAFGDKAVPSARIASTESALFAATLLLQMMAAPDIVGAQVWSLLNNSVWGALTGSAAVALQRRPLFDAMAALAEFGGGRWLATAVRSPTWQQPALGNIPTLPRVAALVAGAALADDGTLRVALVNRSPDQALRVSLRVDAAGPRVREVASARALVGGGVAAPDWRSQGDLALVAADGGHRFNLPPASIALLTFRAAAAGPT
jgi:alpha-N-arabinofuranosidase